MFEFPVSISRDRWWGSTLLSKWHSDVLPSTSDWPPFYQPSTLVSTTGNWYINVNLELPQIFNFSIYVTMATSIEYHRGIAVLKQYYRHIVLLLPAPHVLPRRYARDFFFYDCLHCRAVSTTCVHQFSSYRYLGGDSSSV